MVFDRISIGFCCFSIWSSHDFDASSHADVAEFEPAAMAQTEEALKEELKALLQAQESWLEAAEQLKHHRKGGFS